METTGNRIKAIGATYKSGQNANSVIDAAYKVMSDGQ